MSSETGQNQIDFLELIFSVSKVAEKLDKKDRDKIRSIIYTVEQNQILLNKYQDLLNFTKNKDYTQALRTIESRKAMPVLYITVPLMVVATLTGASSFILKLDDALRVLFIGGAFFIVSVAVSTALIQKYFEVRNLISLSNAIKEMEFRQQNLLATLEAMVGAYHG